MRILVWSYLNEDTGMGHFVRSVEFMRTALNDGHNVYLTGNMQITGGTYFQVRHEEKYDLWHVIHQLKPEWIVVDYPYEIPDYITEMPGNFKILDLNCQGKRKKHVDIGIVQGILKTRRKNIYAGSKYVILREAIFQVPESEGDKRWFVFGGSEDQMGLAKSFHKSFPKEPANLLVDSQSAPRHVSKDKTHMFYVASGEMDISTFLPMTNAVCTAMGMTAWEFATLGVPMYLFSLTEDHLMWAKAMESKGYAVAYPEVGKPPAYKLKQFINNNRDFKFKKAKLDHLAPQRILSIMEKHNETG